MRPVVPRPFSRERLIERFRQTATSGSHASVQEGGIFPASRRSYNGSHSISSAWSSPSFFSPATNIHARCRSTPYVTSTQTRSAPSISRAPRWNHHAFTRTTNFDGFKTPHGDHSMFYMPVRCGQSYRAISSASATSNLEQMPSNKAYVALGSNVGDRLTNIDDALVALNRSGLRITRTSALYETAPMYVEDQATFYNAACEVDIPQSMTPMDLLDTVKRLEDQLGRVKTIEKGPRAIDLDILAFGQEVVDHERLSIPHHSILEREFVLRPLADLIPNVCLPGIKKKASVSSYLSALPQEIPASITPLKPTIPPLQPGVKGVRTQVMGILNMTPDSFSDGGKHSLDPTSPQMQEQLSSWLKAGATILDIGGQSTAPNAPPVTAEEELARTLPLIRHIRSNTQFDGIAISIDTFRAPIARAAVEAGADIVNDVSAGTLDPKMLSTVAQLQVPVILMHMRGDPSNMQTMCDYDPDGLIPTIAKELSARVDAAMAAGIPRWKIILDPGIGFAKEKAQNLEILRNFRQLTDTSVIKGFPWLLGTSRKAFIGHVLGVGKASERDWGTAAAVTAGVAAGADIVRVHSENMAQTVKMADAIWKEAHPWRRAISVQ